MNVTQELAHLAERMKAEDATVSAILFSICGAYEGGTLEELKMVCHAHTLLMLRALHGEFTREKP